MIGNINSIPLIALSYNQPTYLRQLVLWWKWYYPENPIYILDNNSDSPQVQQAIISIKADYDASIHIYPQNDLVSNLKDLLNKQKFEYYALSDVDILPSPSVPPNFLEIFKAVIDSGYHHCGFDLITEDIPEWNKKAGWIQGDEGLLKQQKVIVKGKNGEQYEGWKCPIDTTFCLYSSKNGGWQAPQTSENWTNSVRLFKAFHLGWYQHPDFINDEMKNYYATCKRFEPGMVSAGLNNYRPV